jgi:hypothetical protein
MLKECLGKVWDGFYAVEHGMDIVRLRKFLRELLDYYIAV